MTAAPFDTHGAGRSQTSLTRTSLFLDGSQIARHRGHEPGNRAPRDARYTDNLLPI